MSTLKTIWDCMFSPKLIKIYGNGPVERSYQPYAFEKWGDQVIHSLFVIWKIGMYTSPILVGILYQRGYLTMENLGPLSKLVTSIGVILVVTYCFKGIDRYRNPTYRQFLTTLQAAQKNMKPEVKQQLSKYDFEFKSWPVEFDMTKTDSRPKTQIRSPVDHNNVFQYLATIPFRIIAYLSIHTFGIRFIYPGSIKLLQLVIGQSLQQGRAKLIEYNHGERFKLRTIDNNEIDTMLVDKRNTSSPNGNILVICCEGNAGFYEIGIMVTPIDAGYSVLGWNHPGFGGSTGLPFPPQEQNAMDAVIQFAIQKLEFLPENILLFGWSIGGYPTSWAAMNYPDIKGVVVDATFDDILPLAIEHMPGWWEPIVRLAIREHVNLNIFEQIAQYPGPVLLIRRTEDEVICLKENDLSSNRGNHLLVKLLHVRYPCIFGIQQIELLKLFLSVSQGAQDAIYRKHNVNESMCNSLLQSYVSEFSKSYPMKIGDEFREEDRNQMVLFLAKKYMKDFKSSHCMNLPPELFQQPWDVHVESDYVFT